MTVKIVVPELSESVQEATVGRWLKEEGDRVREGEALVELETDKVDLEVGAEAGGVLEKIERGEGESVSAGDVLGIIEEGATEEDDEDESEKEEEQEGAAEPEEEERPAARAEKESRDDPEKSPGPPEHPEEEKRSRRRTPSSGTSEERAPEEERPQERERLSQRRRTMARRLVEAQRTSATLTTFNDVDMSAVVALRARYREEFRRRQGVDLGIVSFFVRASVAALKAFPRVNSEISGDDLILKRYYDIGIAVADPRGLVVPVLRDCDRMSFAEIEKGIDELASRARTGRLGIGELAGGTFTVTNGGVFGSLLSTPILNPPQVAILGLHRIEDRPVAVSGNVEVRPLMYVALSYDHRVLDGDEAVSFLGRIKELVENPATLLFEG